MLLVLALIACVGNAWAVDWTGTITGRTISSNTTVNLTGTVTLTGSIIISGGTTTINASGANRVINRGGRNFAMFDVRSGATLVIKGGTYKVTIDGKNGSYEATASSQWGYSAIIVRDGGTATLTDVTIRNNYLYTYSALTSSSNSHGGAIFVRGTATCNNCTFSNCKADTGGAIAVFNKGNATINGGKIIQCIARHRGGGALAANTVNYCGVSETAPSGSAVLRLYGVTIGGSADDRNNAQNSFGGGAYSEFLRANIIIDQNTVISYNRSNFGGHGVCVADMGNVELKACDIHHNTPYSKTNSYNGDFGGGGLYLGGTVSGGSTATIEEGCLIHNNSACRGAGVYVGAFQNMAEMTVNMEGGKIYSNTTYTGGNYSAGGGGVYMAGTDTKKSYFNMSGGEIYSNTATSNKGGGIYIQVGAVTITGGKIRNNTAQDDGGGIYLNSGNVTMSGGSVYSNNANGTEKNGGGFYLGGGNFTMSGSAAMYSNTAKAGAGIYLNNGTFKMQGGQFYGNTATGNGGGAYLTANCTFTMSGGSLGTTGKAKNTAVNGGGIYDLGKFTMTGGSIANNEASTHGGGAYISTTQATALSNGTVVGNTATQNGGGIYVTGGSAVTVSGVSVYDNEATGLGGGLYITSSAGNSFTMTGGNIGIEGHPNKAKNGGGVYDLRTFTMNGGSISYNEASTNGGGAFINTTEVTKLSSGTIGHNTAANSGGGIYLSNGSVELTSITFDSNTASNQGGGLFAAASVTLKTGSAFYKNQANQGGGIYVNGGTNTATLSMNNGTVGGSAANANIANQHGGGIYVTGTNSTVTLQGGELSYNQAGAKGGGLFVNSTSSAGTTLSATAKVNYNSAGSDGGGIFVNSGTLTLTGSGTGLQVNNNTAVASGGGLYAANGNVSITGVGTINNNTARDGGAGYVASGTATLTLNGTGNGLQVNNNSASNVSTSYGNGGGFYVGGGNVSISGKCTIDGNSATDDGGGIYTTGGTVTVNGANCIISNNTAEWWGGGIRAGGNVSISSGHIYNNTGKRRGGGVYVSGGNFTMNGGTIGGTTAQGNTTTYNLGAGGGLYMSSGTATITGGSISGNTAPNGYGGGVYMDGGTCTLSNGAVIGGASATYANSSNLGGGVYSAGGNITVRGGKIQYNTAVEAGGGIYTNGVTGVVNMEKQTTKAEMLSYIEYNTAEEGGGIYANRGVVNFSDGYIQYTYASEAGGGIYVADNGGDDYGQLFMKGSAQLIRNHVPTGKKGGGVYLKGVITVGEQVSNPANLGTITAKDNFAYTTSTPDTYVITDETRNNVYLPAPVVDHEYHKDVITVIYNGISTSSEVGFSVPSNYVPVIYCANNGVPCTVTGYEDYTTSQYFLHQFSTGMSLQNNLFDDTHHYVAVHYVNQPLIFDPDHVYLYGFWTNIVITDPTDGHYEEHLDDIDTPEKLAYFISYVNGINDCAGHPHPDAVGNITADIDMSQYGWVPIGELTEGFTGTLNGNGHTITGINSLLYGDHMSYGIVGQLNGGTVKDIFVKDALFALEYKEGLIIGGLVGDAINGGTVENSEISCTILAMHPSTIVGGLIGRMGHESTDTPLVHSSIAITELTGCYMGGLVGCLEKGDLYNSFCNTKFNLLETSSNYMGGLVAVNRGHVANCYARLRGTAPAGNFGILVGDNTNGVVEYCYAPAGMTNYKKVGADPTGHGNYAETNLPNLYRHRDTQVTLVEGEDSDYVPTDANDDKQMMVVLNSWVDDNSTADVTYTQWGRPWQVSNDLKPINDDYPVLRMPLANAMAAKVGDPYIDYNDIDVLLDNYQAADEAIWMYNSDDDVQGDNSASSAKLYIDQDVAMINANPLQAYVSITLDNSAGVNGMNPTYFPLSPDATDWHMISTSLSDAPIGINYSDGAAYDFDYGHPEGMPYYCFYPKDDVKHGYFPSHRYGYDFPASDGNPELTANMGNYYQEWDFYSYSEPDYHWINFKRNSASHHHYDTPDHDAIEYTNETQMIPGKGYFAATREETLLQCFGTLNTDEVTYGATNTTDIAIPRHGYNLLGNPYQAYLNFDLFAEANSDDVDAIWDDVTNASYTILDEDEPELNTMVQTLFGTKPIYYRTYAYGCSSNPDVSAGGFIHPHQGFFIKLSDDIGAGVYFYPDQRDATVTGKFRSASEKIDYPLVNLFAMEDNGNADVVTVELGRPDKGGALLMQSLRTGNGKIWCHYDDKDYTIAFTQPGVTEVPIRFETVEDTEYTLRWNTLHGDFSYMHLIDNKTGADIDCLTTSEYKFSAKKSDYTSRFKLVFDYTGVDENGSSTGSETFAFVMGDDIVVTGEGMLQVFDVTGRMVMSRELNGVQNSVPLYNMSNGVYVLRLTNGKQSQVQKMVISK